MKKTLSMLLAIIIAAIAICTLAVTVFADNDDDDVADSYAKTTAATVVVPVTAAPTTAPTTAAPTTAAPTTTKPNNIIAVSSTHRIDNVIKTNPAGQTAIDDGPAATTKKPSKVVSDNPGTGSNIAVPAVAFLALAAGITAVVKTKKED